MQELRNMGIIVTLTRPGGRGVGKHRLVIMTDTLEEPAISAETISALDGVSWWEIRAKVFKGNAVQECWRQNLVSLASEEKPSDHPPEVPVHKVIRDSLRGSMSMDQFLASRPTAQPVVPPKPNDRPARIRLVPSVPAEFRDELGRLGREVADHAALHSGPEYVGFRGLFEKLATSSLSRWEGIIGALRAMALDKEMRRNDIYNLFLKLSVQHSGTTPTGSSME